MLYNQPNPLEVRILSRRFGLPNSQTIETYLATDGYKALEKALGMTQDEIINEVKASGPARTRRRRISHRHEVEFCSPQSPKPKYIMVNADESEPGTCKDRLLIEYDPHQLIEGILIAGLAVGAQQGYIYIRGEYRYLIDVMDRAIEEAYARGLSGRQHSGSRRQLSSGDSLRRGRL